MKKVIVASLMVLSLAAPSVAAAEPQNSPRMEKAKDLIADEQWVRAIELLEAAAVDPKERNRDEALFWLAHSQHQAGNLGGAVETIVELERKFPASRWVKPARSLRVELAQKLRRDDFLWWIATVAPAPPAHPSPDIPPAAPTPARPYAPTARAPRPEHPPAPPPTPAAVMPAMPPSPPRGTAPAALPAPARPIVWASHNTAADTDLRIQALGSLIQTDASRVIPILRNIALESTNQNEAGRAVFVLAQSGRAEAHTTVLELAREASESVSVAAVRELGRFGGPGVSHSLLQVYEAGKPRVKYQIVNSLGERAATAALLQIAESESDRDLRDTAIVTLGRAGGRAQLQRLYRRAGPELKRPIIMGLFNARGDDELIQIARTERDVEIRREVLAHLRLLGTPKARQYVEKAQPRR